MKFLGEWLNTEARRIQRETDSQIIWTTTCLPEPFVIDGVIGSIEWTAQHCNTSYDCHTPYSWVRTALGPLMRRPWEVMTIEKLNQNPQVFGEDKTFVKPTVLKQWTGKVMDESEMYQILLDHPNAIVEVQPVVKITEEHRTFWKYEDASWFCTGGADYPVQEQVEAWSKSSLDFVFSDHFSLILNRIQDALNTYIPGACPNGLCIDVGVIDGNYGVVEHCAAFGCGTYGATEAYLEAHAAWYASVK